jgi:pilus assembly protein CpaB
MDATERNRRLAKGGAVGFAVIAVVCAGFAAYMTGRIMHARGLEQERKVPVVVAIAQIASAEPLHRELLKVAQWPESNVPPGAVSDLDSLFAGGKTPVAATGIQAGEPVVRARLADPSRGTAMAALVQPGYRGVAVKIDNAVARAGLLYPGAHVDLVSTIRNSQAFVVSTRVAVENLRVLSVEAHTDVESYRPRSSAEGGGGSGGQNNSERADAVVTVEVTPEQAELVILAAREGKVDLALRNGADVATVSTLGVTPAQLAATPPSQHAAHPGAPQAPAEHEALRKSRRKPLDEHARTGTEIETYHAR